MKSYEELVEEFHRSVVDLCTTINIVTSQRDVNGNKKIEAGKERREKARKALLCRAPAIQPGDELVCSLDKGVALHMRGDNPASGSLTDSAYFVNFPDDSSAKELARLVGDAVGLVAETIPNDMNDPVVTYRFKHK